jgi:hypothetical protein
MDGSYYVLLQLRAVPRIIGNGHMNMMECLTIWSPEDWFICMIHGFLDFKSLWQSVNNLESSGKYCSISLKRASDGAEEFTVSRRGMVCF